MERRGLTRRDLKALLNYGLLAPGAYSGDWSTLIIGALLLATLVANFSSPILTGCVCWIPSSQLVHGLSVDPVEIPTIEDGTLTQLESSYRDNYSVRESYAISSVGEVRIGWGHDTDKNAIKRVTNSVGTLSINSTIESVTLPYLQIHSIRWIEKGDEIPAIKDGATPSSVLRSQFEMTPSNVSDFPVDYPILVPDVTSSWASDPLNSTIIHDTRLLMMSYAYNDSRVLSQVHSLTQDLPSDAYTLLSKPFYYAFAWVTFSAGVGRCKGYKCVISSPSMIRYDTPVEIEPHKLTFQALAMVPVVGFHLVMQNNLLPFLWSNINDYVEAVLGMATSAADTNYVPALPNLMADVDHSRVFAWLGLQLLVTFLSILFLIVQSRFSECPLMGDTSLVAFDLDTTGVPNIDAGRKKKCDETQPQCLRCVKSGKVCEGYAPLESPDGRGIMRRGKVAPGRRAVSQLPSSDGLNLVEEKSSTNSPPGTKLSDQQDSSGPLTPPLDSGPSSSQWSGADNAASFSSQGVVWNPNASAQSSLPLAEEKYTGLPTPFASLSPNAKGGPAYPPSSPDGYLIDSSCEDVKPLQTLQNSGLVGYYQFSGPSFPCGSISEVEEEDDLEDNVRVKQEMCIVPVLDPNTADNTLPFVLECYARWINLVVFEPTKAVHPMKESIIHQFMYYPDKRSTIILLANTIGSLGKSIQLSSKMISLVHMLRTYAYQTIYDFMSRQSTNDPETDRQHALDTLDLMMEVVLIQRYSYSMSTIARLMDAAAPVFRQACPEPMNQYVNLPRAVLSPAINIRHFATTDVIISITTGRPLLFRYDVMYPPDILEQFNDGRYGMQWLHGIADQYIVLLARINVLFEEFGTSVNPRYITEIEDQIREVATFTDRSADPVVTIWKFAVRECWKLTMYVYLYMVLCRTSTADPRVLNSVKSYVRLMETVKPGRNPDSFLYIPMIIVGASAYRKQDRAVIQRRMLGLQECIFPGSCGYDAMNMLIDLWARTEAEDRPAVWDDLRESAYRVTGV